MSRGKKIAGVVGAIAINVVASFIWVWLEPLVPTPQHRSGTPAAPKVQPINHAPHQAASTPAAKAEPGEDFVVSAILPAKARPAARIFCEGFVALGGFGLALAMIWRLHRKGLRWYWFPPAIALCTLIGFFLAMFAVQVVPAVLIVVIPLVVLQGVAQGTIRKVGQYWQPSPGLCAMVRKVRGFLLPVLIVASWSFLAWSLYEGKGSPAYHSRVLVVLYLIMMFIGAAVPVVFSIMAWFRTLGRVTTARPRKDDEYDYA